MIKHGVLENGPLKSVIFLARNLDEAGNWMLPGWKFEFQLLRGLDGDMAKISSNMNLNFCILRHLQNPVSIQSRNLDFKPLLSTWCPEARWADFHFLNLEPRSGQLRSILTVRCGASPFVLNLNDTPSDAYWSNNSNFIQESRAIMCKHLKFKFHLRRPWQCTEYRKSWNLNFELMAI